MAVWKSSRPLGRKGVRAHRRCPAFDFSRGAFRLNTESPAYRGRIAPSPTGLLHVGHARTFWHAFERAREHKGTLVLRNENLDAQRCRAEYVQAMFEDLRWLGIVWDEGPDIGGSFGPYSQSERRQLYLAAWLKLHEGGHIYPCSCSRKDVTAALSAPHESVRMQDDEPHYPGTCRAKAHAPVDSPCGMNWRFRVPYGRSILFEDGHYGQQSFRAGVDFSDFLVWRKDVLPSYQLAVVVDDAAMRITDVVRGADLLKSAARQLLIYEALKLDVPRFHHCDLVLDEKGQRLAKRHDSLSVRQLRNSGWTPHEIFTGSHR